MPVCCLAGVVLPEGDPGISGPRALSALSHPTSAITVQFSFFLHLAHAHTHSQPWLPGWESRNRLGFMPGMPPKSSVMPNLEHACSDF